MNHPGLVHHPSHLQQPCHSHHLHLKTRERWLHDSTNHNHQNNFSSKYESLPDGSNFIDGVLTVNEDFVVPTRGTSARERGKNKRASGDYYDKKKTTCMLYLQVKMSPETDLL